MIAAAIRAEWFKLVRRPAIWLTCGLLLALVVLVGYGVTYLVATHTPQDAHQVGVDVAALRSGLYPAAMVGKSLQNAGTLDGVFALMLGVLAQGSEYGWQTVKTSFIQLPGRSTILLARALVVSALMLGLVLIIFAFDGVAAAMIALVDGKSAALPPAIDITRGIAGEWLIFEMMAMLGFGLATFFRQSAMAIGLGFAYALLIENLVFGLLPRSVKPIHDLFPMAGANHLQQSFGDISSVVGITFSSPGAVDVSQAVIVLAVWTCGLVVGSALLTRLRDIT